MEQLKKILGITAVTLIATSANAATITFDDIGIQNSVFPSSAQVRQGFDTEGFHFSNNMDVVDLVGSPWTYYGPAYSGEFAALNDFGGTMVMTKTDRTDFLFSNVFLKSWYGGACKNFCVNGHLAGNCRAPRSDDGRSKESSTQGVAGQPVG